MKKFFLRFSIAFLGSFVAGLFVVLYLISYVNNAVMGVVQSKKTASIKANTVLSLNLNSQINERSSSEILAGLSDNKIQGLDEIIKAIKLAKNDKNISGIYLMNGAPMMGYASLESLRNTLLDFKKSGKFIYGYSEIYTEKGYYLTTVSDSIFIYPTGFMEWNGLASNPMYMKKMFEKLEIEPMLFRVGTFKSAAEPYISDKMSEANRLQISTYLGDFWSQMCEGISERRKISVDSLNSWANGLKIAEAKDALDAHLIDGTKYEDEVLDLMAKKTGVAKDEKVKFVTVSNYLNSNLDLKTSKNKVAVVYAVGDIISGKSTDESVGSETFVKAMREAAEDKNVKVIVLRVNSPGGSALASDVMAREVINAKKIKPVIVSMGDLAASGGYYIAAYADKIVAEPTTITGSIGVFGLLFNTQKMVNNKLGINVERVTTNNYADLGNPNRPMGDFEKKSIQQSVNAIYGDFVNVVKEGRHYPDSVSVDSIAQGRVWSGKRAKTIGLVDEIGGLDVAIAIATKKVAIGDDFEIVEFPKNESWFEKLINNSKEVKAGILSQVLSAEEQKALKWARKMQQQQGIFMFDPNLVWD